MVTRGDWAGRARGSGSHPAFNEPSRSASWPRPRWKPVMVDMNLSSPPSAFGGHLVAHREAQRVAAPGPGLSRVVLDRAGAISWLGRGAVAHGWRGAVVPTGSGSAGGCDGVRWSSLLSRGPLPAARYRRLPPGELVHRASSSPGDTPDASIRVPPGRPPRVSFFGGREKPCVRDKRPDDIERRSGQPSPDRARSTAFDLERHAVRARAEHQRASADLSHGRPGLGHDHTAESPERTTREASPQHTGLRSATADRTCPLGGVDHVRMY